MKKFSLIIGLVLAIGMVVFGATPAEAGCYRCAGYLACNIDECWWVEYCESVTKCCGHSSSDCWVSPQTGFCYDGQNPCYWV